ncbi:MAG TPA: hypothetical protein PK671_15295, partial [Candidatus Obscuribacter sp.]|nr:hypothetical protein [Candidatus Obscuribacter sp.]
MQKQLENTPGTASIALDEPAPGSTRTKLHQSEDFYVDLDENGIAGLWFACTKNANVLGQSTLDQLKIILDLLKKDTKVRGILLASAKKDHFVYGADLHETPRLDRLARQGVRFT